MYVHRVAGRRRLASSASSVAFLRALCGKSSRFVAYRAVTRPREVTAVSIDFPHGLAKLQLAKDLRPRGLAPRAAISLQISFHARKERQWPSSPPNPVRS